ncbi:MAG: hypothetical protein IT345_11880 [Trueperaceae bacterium]|nr:hypothetical protein [Trueperaceae bacterium]
MLRGLALLLDDGERSRLLGLLARRSGLGRTGLGVRVADAQEKEEARRDATTRRTAALPQIVVNNRQLRDVIADAWAALHAANDPPVVFRRSGHLVRLGVDEGGLKIQGLDEAAAYGRLARVADWLRLRKDEPPVQISPPKDVARDLLAYPDAGVAHLEAVVTAPFFGCSGELVVRPGYHAGDRVWLDSPPDLIGLEVPRHPSPDDVAAARRLLVDDLLLDFPFVEPSDCAHMVAALMLPFVRRLVAGVTPIHLVEAPAVGSGKGLLCSLVEVLATGTTSVARTLPVNEDEARKLLTAEITLGRGVILLDNASERRRLDCAPLASVLTSEFWTDRILGRTEMTTLPNRAVWLLTANNPEMSMELARRCVRIRIDPRVDRPWLRDQFKHRHLVRWAKQHRVELVRAILVLVQSWLAAGRAPGATLLGSFEGWSEILGGILAHAGIAGFLANLEELYERADVEGQQWREFTAAWHARFGDQPVKVTQLFELCQESELLAPVLGDKSERSQLTRLGTALRRAKDRVFGELRVTLVQDSSHKGRLYALEAVGPASPF